MKVLFWMFMIFYGKSDAIASECNEIMSGSNSLTAVDVLKVLDLSPLPGEGGFYRETYRQQVSTRETHPATIASTAIYYMVTPESFSSLHRLKHDEIFHFYAGSSVEMFLIFPDGKAAVVKLGADLLNGERPQVVVPSGTWQGTIISGKGAWSLLGTTMAPAFEFKDLEIAERNLLIEEYPNLEFLIKKYTR